MGMQRIVIDYTSFCKIFSLIGAFIIDADIPTWNKSIMWCLKPTDLFQRKLEQAKKKTPDELRAVSSNLKRYMDRLQHGDNPNSFIAAYVHSEPQGIKAITQQGKYGKDIKQFRLYLFPDTTSQTLHLLTLGDKRSQKDDIKDSQKLHKSITGGQNNPS